MEKVLIKENEFVVSKWSGGSTSETGIFPSASKYLERDFIWRLSSATVDLEESSFTRLPDYDRILMVLEGEAVLAYGQQRSVSLKQYEQDSFDGGIKTKCFGKIRDYNLMVRKGCAGRLEKLSVKNSSMKLDVSSEGEYTNASYGIFCVEGYIIASIAGVTTMIRAGQQLVLNCGEDDREEISVMGEGTGVFAGIFYDITAYSAEEVPEGKASPEDYKAALKMMLGRNKWNQMLQAKRGTGIWYDRVLQKKLRFIDKTNINIIIWIVGVILTIAIFVGSLSTEVTVGILLGWTVFQIFVIAPMIYIIVLPTPIKAHIKNVEDLNDFQRKLYEEDQGGEQNLAKLMNKYKSSDEEGFLREGESRIRRLFK
ncbi:MAG: HutD family protein [Clostridiales bacterium]|nr:HutD family protein [Clostridiales bacterium]